MRGATIALVAIAVAALVGTAVLLSRRGDGGPRADAPTIEATVPKTLRKSPQPRERSHIAWPTYGYNLARTHVAPRTLLRPPFRRIWKTHGDWSLMEMPPVIAYGRLYSGTLSGLVMSVEGATGRMVWQRRFRRCIAASPTVGARVVYVVVMSPPPCRGDRRGFLIALDADTGSTKWRFRAGPIESPPLLVDGLVYFGSWDRHVYAVDARTGQLRWKFETAGQVKAGPAWWRRTLYIGSYDGRMYALAGRTGRLRWSARGGSFYATPAVANGLVFAGATDGVVYAYRAHSGRLAWSTSTGSFVYSPAAVWRNTVYVGSYDHNMYALDARSGRARWSYQAGHPISGAPTILNGLLYFSTCGSCSQYESDPQARRTYALDARTGRLAWRFGDGEYSPVVADGKRVYLTGFQTLYGLVPKH